jgi:dimethylhistidine N-methyltransferase/ergothioneine biosynthesis protein EgtC
MCRHLGYLGPAVSLSSLIFDPPHSLLTQTWAPSDMRHGGTVNVDGFGVGWYVDGSAVRYRRAVPLWTDQSFAAVAATTRSDAVLAAVRSATVGMPICDDACAPFTDGHWLFSHNGSIAGWPHSVTALAAELPTADLLTLDAPTDSAFIWALIRHRLHAGADPADVVAEVARTIGAMAPDSRLNFMLTDGRTLIATTWWHALSVWADEDRIVLASEPWDDDPQWTTLGDRLLITATLHPTAQVRVSELNSESLKGNEVHTSDTAVEVHLPEDHAARSLAADVRTGLTATPKSLPPKWFYDTRGSELFEQITRLTEYYPTRAEREILSTRAGEIAEVTGAHTLVELGSGSSEKTRLLLDALRDAETLSHIVLLDVSESALRDATTALSAEYPDARVNGVVGDFTEHLGLLPGEPARLVAFLGGTIGNFLPDERGKFLASVRGVLEPGEWLLLGTDLVKDETTLVRAYDDAAGVTAEFNQNVLHVLNRELDADFDVANFHHVALWDKENEWIEMRLRADGPQHVRIAALDLAVDFEDGEELRTEISAKFRREGVAEELTNAGFTLHTWWTDEEGRFALSLARAS